MASSASRAKRDREKAKQERAAAKRERKLTVADASLLIDDAPVPTGPPRTQQELLDELALVHQQFEDGQIDLEEFESTKQRVIGQLAVE